MVTASARLLMSREAYLEYDRTHEGKHEFVNGEVMAMGGGSLAHNVISLNVGSEFRSALKGRPCVVASSDQRVNISSTGLYCYPDVVVACGERRLSDENPPSLMNPTFIVEVLSPSTENHDRGAKAAHFRRLESLQGYLLVSSMDRHVELYVRAGSAWVFSEATGSGTIDIPPLQMRLALDEVYLNALDPSGTASG